MRMRSVSRNEGIDKESQHDWALQVEEAVALRSILDTDFIFGADDTHTDELDRLYHEITTEDVARPVLETTFTVIVRPVVPQHGLTVQVASSSTGSPGGEATIHSLPPITLQLHLPHHYPSSAVPRLLVRAPWLSAEQLAKITEALDGIAAEGLGLQIAYSLVDWLENDLLDYLDIKTSLEVSSAVDNAARGHQNSDTGNAEASEQQGDVGKALAADEIPKGILHSLLRYDASRQQQIFDAGVWRCDICFEDLPGQRCLHAATCPHFFCTACLQGHCRAQLQEGRLDLLTCPDHACKQPLLRSRLAPRLSQADARRWEELELQATLRHMSDVVFCPRCSSTCIEDSDHTGICPGCHFAFCSLCQSAYHGGQKCVSAEVKLQILKERMAGRNDTKLIQELKRKEQDLLSLASIEKESKPCPVCSVPITKTEGCNKMTCTVCGCYFCWLCNKRVEGYEHFREQQCMLFDEQEVQAWNMQHQAVHPGENEYVGNGGVAAMRGKACCQCGQWNAKRGNLNLLTCWACGCRYCYLCHKNLRKGEGGTHFRPTGCKQHSAD